MNIMRKTTFELDFGRLPKIVFGAGALGGLARRLRDFGTSGLLITGGKSFLQHPAGAQFMAECDAGGLCLRIERVDGEPSPEWVDAIVSACQASPPDFVIGAGGGSAMDAAKAVAGLLRPGNSVMDHLEGVGPERPYTGPATPFIAIPTTAGTGSEATRNAVLSRQGPGGFKKSFRDDKLVAVLTVVDPDLLSTCPPALVAANGMDALTQLLESYVSLRANPVSDALALAGLEAVRDGLIAWHANTSAAAAARERMAYAALLSGITLAQVGLGSVHGLAAPLGAFFPIPHGVACGTLVAKATAVNLAALGTRQADSPALVKYARVGRLLSDQADLDDAGAQAALVALLQHWQVAMAIPALGDYGVTAAEVPRLVANSRGSSMKTNPVVLTDAEIAEIILHRL
jgi:alcohol dehydrogenase